jgi:hypothetical protein
MCWPPGSSSSAARVPRLNVRLGFRNSIPTSQQDSSGLGRMCGGSRPGEAVRWVWRRADQSPAPMFSTLRFGHLARGYSNVNPCGPVSPGVARCVEAVPVRIHPLLEVGRLPARGSRLPRPDVQCEAEACPGDSTPPAHTTLHAEPAPPTEHGSGCCARASVASNWSQRRGPHGWRKSSADTAERGIRNQRRCR